LVVEIQQPSDVTYRLSDWNRLGPEGRPRPLHVEQALEVIDFSRGAVFPQPPRATDRRQVTRLVACDYFEIHRWDFDTPLSAAGDQIVFTYDTQVERTGIAALLSDIHRAGIRFRDLETRQSSLEDIFVGLVSDRR
jgi:mannose-6-phosphate isomerase class I